LRLRIGYTAQSGIDPELNSFKGHLGSVDDIKRIRIPTLVLWGEKDSIFTRAAEDELIRELPHAQFSAYPETGHALHWERPERFSRELLAFIQSKPKQD